MCIFVLLQNRLGSFLFHTFVYLKKHLATCKETGPASDFQRIQLHHSSQWVEQTPLLLNVALFFPLGILVILQTVIESNYFFALSNTYLSCYSYQPLECMTF